MTWPECGSIPGSCSDSCSCSDFSSGSWFRYVCCQTFDSHPLRWFSGFGSGSGSRSGSGFDSGSSSYFCSVFLNWLFWGLLYHAMTRALVNSLGINLTKRLVLLNESTQTSPAKNPWLCCSENVSIRRTGRACPVFFLWLWSDISLYSECEDPQWQSSLGALQSADKRMREEMSCSRTCFTADAISAGWPWINSNISAPRMSRSPAKDGQKASEHLIRHSSQEHHASPNTRVDSTYT